MLHLLASLAAILADEGVSAGSGAGRPPSPEAALREIRVDAGLRVELVAAEPAVESPVAMTFSEDGRLWVVEMRDYPEGPPEGSPPEGRIRVLDDRDGDGYHEESSVFAGGLLFANGLQRWRGGFVVTAAPRILYLEDTDGDGRADREETIYEGFSTENSQLLASFPTLSIDNWIHVANGLRGGEARRSGRPDAEPVPLAGKDFRFDPLREREEAVSGMGQFGLAFDAWGRRFVCDNRHHLRHVVLESRYLDRNPHIAPAEAVEDTSELDRGAGAAGSPIHPISRHWTNFASHAGRFTAACGILVYEGDLLPEPWRGAVFTCDPTANLVHGEALRPEGATFRSRPLRDGVEFLASRDDWFRPVSLAEGPDGALYVADMCRATVEHPAWLAESVRHRFDYRAGKDRGRIWRVVPRTGAPPRERPRLGHATSAAELAALLSHRGSWWRRTAQRLLLEREDESARLLLGGLVESSSEPLARIHAAWLLHGLGGIDARHVNRLLADPHPRVRQHALVLAEPILEREDTFLGALRLAADPDPAVRFQAALSLGERDDARIIPALARIAEAGAADRWTRLAVATAAPRSAGSLLGALLAPRGSTGRASPDRLALIREIAAVAGARGEEEDLDRAVAALSALGAHEAFQTAGLAGIAGGMARDGRRLSDLAPPGAPPGTTGGKLRAMLSRAARWAAGEGADSVEMRRDAVRLLGHAPWEDARPALEAVLRDAGDDLRGEAARALAAHGHPGAFAILLDAWSRQGAAVRRETAGALLASREGTLSLLGAIEDGRIAAAELGAARIAQILGDRREDVRALARKVLDPGVPEERRLVIERYRAALGLEGADGARGRAVFEEHCASCHRVGGLGVAVGPDISDVQARDPEALLADIIDPGRAIDGNHVQYVVTLADGYVVTGLLAAEGAEAITLRRAGGETLVVRRSEVAEIRPGAASLMPDGIEKSISVEEMADLIAFLRDGRYLEGAPPLLAPARAAGARAAPRDSTVAE